MKNPAEIKEYFYSPEQAEAVRNLSPGKNRVNYVLTPEGFREYTEMATKGVYENSTNNWGAKAFFEGVNAKIKVLDRHCAMQAISGAPLGQDHGPEL